MKSIVFMNEKGGVGKTSLAVNLASYIAWLGQSALIIDADAQRGGATQYCGVAPAGGLYDWLVTGNFKSQMASNRLWGKDNGGAVHVLPSNESIALVAEQIKDDQKLRAAILDCRHVFDWVIVDASPTPSRLNAMLLMAVDWVVLPTTLDFPSFGSMVQTMEHLSRANDRRERLGIPPAKIAGIVPTMCDWRTVLHRSNMDALKAQYQALVMGAVINRVAWREAWQAKQSVMAYAPKALGAFSARRFCIEVLKRIEGENEDG